MDRRAAGDRSLRLSTEIEACDAPSGDEVTSCRSTDCRFFPEAKYIFVGRDPRDVFMSLWNHYSNYTDANFASVNNPIGLVGPPLPPCPTDSGFLAELDRQRLVLRGQRRVSLLVESSSHEELVGLSHLPNLLFVHYNDLLADLPGEIFASRLISASTWRRRRLMRLSRRWASMR